MKHNPAYVPAGGMLPKELPIECVWWYWFVWLLQDPNKQQQWYKKVAEAESKPIVEEKIFKKVIFEVSGAEPDKNKKKLGKPFEMGKTNY